MNDALVLVTGGTGFIAQHCILALLNRGYRVRTTVRSLTREMEVRANLKRGGAEPGERLSFVTADLGMEQGWAEGAAGCAYVLHGASPTPTGSQTSEEEWIRPAVDGNLRVLRAARDAGVRRVVLTSAFGAICAGHGPMGRPFTETDWSDLQAPDVWPYQKSKTLSEQAAWDFVAREGRGLELSAINPVVVLGPVFGPDYSHSIRLIKSMGYDDEVCSLTWHWIDVNNFDPKKFEFFVHRWDRLLHQDGFYIVDDARYDGHFANDYSWGERGGHNMIDPVVIDLEDVRREIAQGEVRVA